MQACEEEDQPQSPNTDALEHAQRTGLKAEDSLEVKNGDAQHSCTDERAGEIDFLAAV
jgi:hypothetical protein